MLSVIKQQQFIIGLALVTSALLPIAAEAITTEERSARGNSVILHLINPASK